MPNKKNRGSHGDSPLMLDAAASSNGKPLPLGMGSLTIFKQSDYEILDKQSPVDPVPVIIKAANVDCSPDFQGRKASGAWQYPTKQKSLTD